MGREGAARKEQAFPFQMLHLLRCEYWRLLRFKACLLCGLLAAHLAHEHVSPMPSSAGSPVCGNRKQSCSWRDKAHSWDRLFLSKPGIGRGQGRVEGWGEALVGSCGEMVTDAVLWWVLRLRAGEQRKAGPGRGSGTQTGK